LLRHLQDRPAMTRVIVRDVNILRGEPVFRGPGVLCKTLIDPWGMAKPWINFRRIWSLLHRLLARTLL